MAKHIPGGKTKYQGYEYSSSMKNKRGIGANEKRIVILNAKSSELFVFHDSQGTGSNTKVCRRMNEMS